MRVGPCLFFFRNPLQKKSNQHEQHECSDGKCVVLVRKTRGMNPVGHTEELESKSKTHWHGNDNPEVNALWRHGCKHQICTCHCLGPLSSNQHWRRKQLHCIEKKNVNSNPSAPKFLQALVATLWEWCNLLNINIRASEWIIAPWKAFESPLAWANWLVV